MTALIHPTQTIAETILWLAAIWSTAFCAYLSVLLLASLVALRRPASPSAPARQVRRFLVLIPAHDEETIIARAVRSALSAQADNVAIRVLVVADNCSDQTGELAANAGAEVIHRRDPQRRGKGWALDYGIRHALHDRWLDAVFVMDADSVVSPNAFEVLQPRLQACDDCIQIRYQVANADTSWRTKLMAAAFDLRCHILPMGRQTLGLSASLMGNGMCFSRNVFEETGWPSKSLAEDIEATAILVQRGVRIWYEPRAAVAAEMPSSSQAAGTQRFRWEIGQLISAIRWMPRLLATAIRQKRLDPLNQILAMLNPPLGFLVLVICAAWAAVAILSQTHPSWTFRTIWLWPALLLTLMVYVVGGLWRSGHPGRALDVIVFSPIYVLWKLWFYISIPWRGSAGAWVRTARNTLAVQQQSGAQSPHAALTRATPNDPSHRIPITTSSRKYLVISPVRDEARWLQCTIDSVVAQTVRPALWIIVDDGSSDDTPKIAARAAQQHGWIRLHRRPDRGQRKLGGGVVEAFYDGLALARLDDYEYVCKLDGDLEFVPTYFQRLFEKFELDPRLGTASGKCWLVTRKGLIHERIDDEFSLGACKTYRRVCFQKIGGFVRELMWDGIDSHKCRMHGWRARSFAAHELRIRHLRQLGSSMGGVLRGRLRWGCGQYFMGTHPLYALGIAGYRAFERPWILGGLFILIGYVSAHLRRRPRYDDLEFRKHLRHWQLSRLRLAR